MQNARRRVLAVAVLVVLAALNGLMGACSATQQRESTATPQVALREPASAAESEDPGIPPGEAFFLDLRTGEQTPLSSTSVDDFGSGAPFHEGHYYAVSPDGSRIYWENECCSADDVAAEASIDGSDGGRVDPPGRINHYAGGWSPDGTKFVYQRRDGSINDFGNLFVKDMTSGRSTRITNLEQHTSGLWYLAPTFSSDSRSVIFQWPRDSSSSATWDLWSVPVTGGEPRVLVRNAAQPATFDGPTYAFVRPKGDNFIGSRLVITTPDGFKTLVEASSEIFEPKMSPDGSRIAYSDGGTIYVVDVSSGETSEVAEGRMAAWLDDETLIVAPE